ncbi:MAG: Histidine kinase [Clostridia bacterium]|jgi:sensor histidine kinase YesM|nr:Histidine kinase [Clostridia bacterium]
MRRMIDLMKSVSIRVQLIFFSVLMSCMIGGIAFFVLHWNAKALQNDSEYMNYIFKINKLYQIQEENGKYLYQVVKTLDEEAKMNLRQQITESYELLKAVELSSVSVDSNVRIRVTRYLLKRFENHVEEVIWLRKFEDNGTDQVEADSSYYVIYMESLDILSRITTYLQEILRLSVEENREFIEKASQNNKRLKNLIIFFVCIVVVASISFCIFFSNYVTGLIKRIASMTKKIAKGSEKHEIMSMAGPKEIQELTSNFNQLLDTIYELNGKAEEKVKLELRLSEEKLEKMKVRELLKESQLQGLQTQINPHFLFNTLNVISMTALLENADQAYALMIALSKFMRHYLKKVKSNVPLEEELDMISQYLYILKARMGEQFLYSIQCDVKTKEIKIPVFTLQPIVENAFKHGIEDQVEQGRIDIRIKERNRSLYLSIYDNGKGMTKEEIDSVRKKLRVHDVDFGDQAHIGIENVGYRLNLVFENRVKYYVRSSSRKGTIFTIQIILE